MRGARRTTRRSNGTQAKKRPDFSRAFFRSAAYLPAGLLLQCSWSTIRLMICLACGL
jgi:hypothetical protein